MNFLCELTNKVNLLTEIINNMQQNTGLYTDPSSVSTLTGRIKALEESVVNSDPKETNISRLQVDTGRIIENGTFTTTYSPIGDCVNREVQIQSPNDPEIWETVGSVSFLDNVCNIGTTDYDGWLATVSYIYAEKINIEQFSFTNALNEIVKNLYDYNGTVYRIILKIVPTGSVEIKWEDNNTKDYFSEIIETEHIRYIAEEEFNNTLYITGTAEITMELRNRIA
jgi:hypothetical protein